MNSIIISDYGAMLAKIGKRLILKPRLVLIKGYTS